MARHEEEVRYAVARHEVRYAVARRRADTSAGRLVTKARYGTLRHVIRKSAVRRGASPSEGWEWYVVAARTRVVRQSRSESASAWEVTRQGQWEWVRVEGIAEVGSVATDRRRMSRYGVSLRSRSGGSERYVVAGGNGMS